MRSGQRGRSRMFGGAGCPQRRWRQQCTGELAAAVLLMLSLAAIGQAAQVGDLDTSFSGDGTVITDFNFNRPEDLVVQPNGKLVVVGSSFILVRYNPNGTLDLNFGDDGKVTTDFSGSALALQPDGKLVVAGEGNFEQVLVLARYNPNGTLDPTFSGDGKVTTDDFGAFDGLAVTALAIQPDGKIVVAGILFADDVYNAVVLARYTPHGTLDPTFSGDGMVVINRSSDNFDHATGLVLQPDGKILVTGYSDKKFLLARFRANGALDATFRQGGWVTTPFPGCSSSSAS